VLSRTSTRSERANHVAKPGAGSDRSRRMRRRPSGEPPPLPREHRSTRWVWVLAAVLLLGAGLKLLLHTTQVVQAADQAVLAWFAEARTPLLTGLAEVLVLLTRSRPS
jgi:hypothetical protein